MNEDLLLAIFEREGFKAKGISFDEFKTDMQDQNLQQEIFKRAGFEKKGIKFDEFVGDLGFTQKKVNTTPTLKFSPVQDALLDAIADVESSDYNVIVGHTKDNPKLFSDYSKHPEIVGVTTKYGDSDAAGLYQFLSSTWNKEIVPALGLKDFSPDSQRIGALYYAEKRYKELTGGRNIYQDIEDGKLENIQQVLGGVGDATVWQGLQGDKEFPNRFKAHLSRYETMLKEAEEKRTPQEKLSDATAGLKKAGADLNKVANDIVYKLDDTETVEIKGLPSDLGELKKGLDNERKNLEFAKKDYLLKRDTEVERLKQEFQSSETYLNIDKKYNDEYNSYTKKFFEDNIKNNPEYMGVHSKLSADLNSGVLTQEEANKKLNEYINRKASEDAGVKDFADSLGKRKSEDMNAALNGYVDADEKISSLTTQWDNIYGKSRVKQQTFLDRYNGVVDEYNKQAKQKTEEKRTSKQVGLPGGGPYATGERPKDYSGGYVKINKTSADYEKDYEDLKNNFEKDALLSTWYQKNDRPLPESKKQKILQNFNTFNKKKEEILLKKYDALKEEIFTMDPIELGRTSIKDFNEKVNAYGDINRGYFEQDQVAGKEYVKKLIDFKAAAEIRLASKYGDKYTEYVKDMDAIDILIKSGKKPSPEKIKEIQEKYSDIRNDDDWLLANREVPKLYKAAEYEFSQLADKYQQAERLREIDKQQLIADTPTLYSSPLRWIGKAFGGKALGQSIKTVGGLLDQTDKIPDEIGDVVWGPGFKLISPILGEWGRKMMTSGGDMLDRNPFESRMQGQATETYALAPTGEKVVFDDEGKVKYIRNEDGTMYKGFGAEDIIKSVDGVKKEWGFNPMSFLGQALDVGAMMIPTIVMSLGTAGLGLAAGVGSRGVAIMSKIGMFAGGFGEGYSSIKEEALKQSKMSYDDIDIMSTIGGFTVGITELFNPVEGKLFNKILPKKFINENVVGLASGKMGIADYVLNIATNFAKGGVKESLFEEAPQQLLDSKLKNYYNVKNGTEFATQLSTDEWIDLISVSLGVGGLGDAMRTGSPSYLGKEALKVITNNRDLYDAYLSGMEKTDKERAAKIRADIDPMLQELDAATADLSPIRKDKAAELLFDIKSTENKLNSIKEPVLRKPYEDKLAALRKELGDTIQVKTDEKGEPIEDTEETTTKTTKPKTDAVQEQKTTEVPVQPKAEGSGTDTQGQPQPKPEGTAEQGKAQGQAQSEEVTKPIESFETAKGSVYTVLPDGKTQRFKTATGEKNDPQDLIVFAKFKDSQQEQDFLSAQNRKDGQKLVVVDKDGNIYNTNEEVKGKDVKLAIIKDGNIIDTAETSIDPKIGYNTFDQRRFEKDGEPVRSTHLGNKVTKINYKSPEPVESTISTEQGSTTTQGEKVAPTQPQEAQNANILTDFEVTTTKGTAAPRTYTKNSNGKWIAQTKKEDGTLSKGVPVSSANVVAQLDAESSKRAAETNTPELPNNERDTKDVPNRADKTNDGAGIGRDNTKDTETLEEAVQRVDSNSIIQLDDIIARAEKDLENTTNKTKKKDIQQTIDSLKKTRDQLSTTQAKSQTQTDENISTSKSESKTSEEGKMDTPLDKEQGKGREEGSAEEKVKVKSVIESFATGDISVKELDQDAKNEILEYMAKTKHIDLIKKCK